MAALPQQRLSIITLGVKDLAVMVSFYTDVLGFEDRGVKGEVAFFNAGGMALGLWDETKLAADAGMEADRKGGFRGFALAFNARSIEEVDAIFSRLGEAGVRIPKAPHKTYWGGYSGYFADPEGNAWEVAFNPFWPMDEAGRVTVPARKER
ncbi:MAG: VOC family protein [Hyphomonas sp.]|uniref:VOC family protein n=1 Tax=Hyphomonas sp. TaxID=87 RepID=UPI0034A03517